MNPQRIEEMEQRLRAAECAVRDLEDALSRFEKAQDDIAALDRYLGSKEWYADRADDEAGRLPHGMLRGVLSEDAIWNLLERNREVNARLADKPDAHPKTEQLP